MSQLRVFTFFPAFGLPTGGPFALKLLKWLDIGGIDYEQVIENDSGKGPNKKNPWVELNGERIPDSELIIDRLTDVYGFDIDAGLEPTALARLHAFRRMIEEHLHMVFEWEMFVHPNGRPFVVEVARSMAPRPFAGMAASMVCRQLGKQLHAAASLATTMMSLHAKESPTSLPSRRHWETRPILPETAPRLPMSRRMA